MQNKAQLKMPFAGYVDKMFTEIGFSNWQKTLDQFHKHEHTARGIKLFSKLLLMTCEIK